MSFAILFTYCHFQILSASAYWDKPKKQPSSRKQSPNPSTMPHKLPTSQAELYRGSPATTKFSLRATENTCKHPQHARQKIDV